MAFIFVALILVVFLPSDTLGFTLELKKAVPANNSLPTRNFTLTRSSSLQHTGYYYTTLEVGSPRQQFHLIVNTGSDATWLSCSPCVGCPAHNEFGIRMSPYYPNFSSSASTIGCFDKRCPLTKSLCGTNSSKCIYSIAFEDGSMDIGYFVEDIFQFEGGMTDSSTSILFGCSHLRMGAWSSNISIDGVLGLGHYSFSIISQLSSQRIIRKVFSHCLRRDDGGVLVLGGILHPDVVYSPLIPSGYNYNLNLRSIAISGEIVHIAPESFGSYGVFIDMSTPISIIGEKAYEPLINFLIAGASLSKQPVFNQSTLCFDPDLEIREYDWHMVDDIFPVISFNFEGGASMVVRPKDYFIWQDIDDITALCIGFKKGHNRTVFGGDVLRDRIVTYDLVSQRLGWMDYDCSQSVNDVTHRSASNSTISTLLRSMLASIATLLVCIFTL